MSPSGKAIRGVAAVIFLFVVLMLVMNYWGDYRSTKRGNGDSQETTSSAEATGTADDGSGETGGDAAEARTVLVLTDGLKFREKASRDAKMIGQLNEGDRLDYLGTEDGWYKVRAQDGTEGFVSTNDQYSKLEK